MNLKPVVSTKSNIDTAERAEKIAAQHSMFWIGANVSELTERMEVPPGSLVYGSPAKIVSQLADKERTMIQSWAEKYCRIAANYRGAA